jgi:succinate dehydrogenase (ubiquinone) cytochrome b560 subunit
MLSRRSFQLLSRTRAVRGALIGLSPVTRQLIARRTISTQFQPDSTTTILEKQRLARPVSPHLSIYKPQITWLASSSHRLTGVLLSGGLYLWSTAYLVGPTVGFQAGSTTLAAAFAAWPFVLKAATKATVAFSFVFHCFDGLRHIAWDFGLGFAKSRVIQTGWFIIGLSAVSSLYLALAS